LHVLDLGCGVGASLIYLAAHSTVQGTGITISGVQASYATERIAKAGLSDRLQCLQGNFLELPTSLAPAHLAFSIEAFIHGPDPAAYFSAAAGRTVPGGLLIVCDDFLSERGGQALTKRDARILANFRAGWHAHSLMTVAQANEFASGAGYKQEKNVNLTPFLDLRRPRDLVASVALKLGRYLPVPARYRQSLVGGTALQAGLVSGLIEFRYLVWRLSGAGRQ
jgi:cyclopropane fatty-acyl-phospholipid synthase-like methyltransferase